MPFSVEIHLPTQLTVPPRVFARHVVDSLSRARFNWLVVVPELHKRHEAVTLLWIRRGHQQRLPPGCGEGVSERGEDEQEEEKDEGEEGGGDYVQELPLTRVSLRRREIQVTHCYLVELISHLSPSTRIPNRLWVSVSVAKMRA